jgi:thymidylate kinase
MNDLASQMAVHEVVLLEGCDGAGKTTVASRLVAAHGYELVHAQRTPDGIDLFRRYRAILQQPGRLVLDRGFVSELVYGPLFHGGSRLSLGQALELAALVRERHGVLVHLTASPEQIAARLRRRDGCSPPLEQVQALLKGYASVFRSLARAGPVITVDTTVPDA